MSSNRPFGKMRFSLLLQYIQTVKGSLILPEMKIFLFLKVLICLLLLKNTHAITCPLNTLDGYILSGTITAALSDAVVPLTQQEDYFCYNYSLQYQLSRPPEIAISVHDFEVEVSKNLFFYIKAYNSQSTILIPFVIRTQWAYTSWVKITFSFLAEDRTDIQSGYYQVDSGPLASLSLNRNVPLFLPFRSAFNQRSQIKYILFLHGFQITTIKQLRGRTPFEIQLINSQVNATGISVTASTTTLTKIDSIFISYIAIQSNKFRMQYGKYIYDNGNFNTTLSNIGEGVIQYLPKNAINRNYARLFGLSGFIFNHINTKLKYQTLWDSSAFKFSFFSNIKQNVPYFTFDYIFFLGSFCQFCSLYPFEFEGKCVNNCPQGTSKTYQNICIDCGVDKVWNGTNCVKFCYGGQFLNIETNLCECPPLLNWNGFVCVICTSGKIFNASSRVCQCSQNQTWDGNKCSIIPPCVEGKSWNTYTFTCQCQEHQYWNVSKCVKKPVCQGGQIYNSEFKCVCQPTYYWNGQNCSVQICKNGMIWTGTKCVCPAGTNFNKKMCVTCINGQKWNKKTETCDCQSGFEWNGNFCQKSKNCGANRQWSEQYQYCICENNMYWNGLICKKIQACPLQQYFDFNKQRCLCKQSEARINGTICVVCSKGKIWKDNSGFACICPFGSFQIAGECYFSHQCTGKKIWFNGSKQCQCPPKTIWNGTECSNKICNQGKISTPLSDCQCPHKTVLQNGHCLPIRYECKNGRIWNERIKSCQCPSGQYFNIAECQNIPVCGGLKVYNPLTNSCNCPIGTVPQFQKCSEVQCKQGQIYNGFQCQVISCPPPTYFKDNKCVMSRPLGNKCPFSYYWNGFKCQYYSINCPAGTVWRNFSCMPSNSGCQYGQYRSNGNCTKFSQLCNYPLFWKENKCMTSNGACPPGTFLSLGRCLPMKFCSKEFVWDPTLLKCVCRDTSFYNGDSCIQCESNKQWKSGQGCVCRLGKFDTGNQCTYINQEKCRSISNAFWHEMCLCRPGFTKKGMNCICRGVQIGQLCDMCSFKPNSIWVEQLNYCNCKKDYVQFNGECLSLKKNYKGSDFPESCTVGTYYQKKLSMCLSCSEGCLSCKNNYKCIFCRPQYYMQGKNQKCFEICGDGKKFTNECDDGNNEDGDGCSKDCKIEKGFNCLGGSPFSSDSCFLTNTNEIELELLGQIRKQSSIILEIRLSALPFTILAPKPIDPKILEVKIRNKSQLPVHTQTRYKPGTQYIFSVELQYGRPYIGTFEAQINIQGYIRALFFGSSRIMKPLEVKVQPKYLLQMPTQQIK